MEGLDLASRGGTDCHRREAGKSLYGMTVVADAVVALPAAS